jgi:hypothetical protein
MNNILDIGLEFDFKGEHFSLRSTVDLDEHMVQYDRVPSFYDILARDNGIDPYSYHYEIMAGEAVKVITARGMAADFVEQGVFTVAAFEQAWRARRLGQQLSAIAKEHLGVASLEEEPALLAALRAAYEAGRDSDKATPAI